MKKITMLQRCMMLNAVWLLMAFPLAAQTVGTSISDDGSPANSNAMLDVQSPTTGDGKGLLIPRITQNQRTSANGSLAGGLLKNSGDLRGGPAKGLMVYQTDGAEGFYYNTSTTATPSWQYIGTANGDFMANGSVPMTGGLDMNGQNITNVNVLAFQSRNVAVGNGARSYSSIRGSVAVGRNATARYRNGGVAIGADADGDYNGVAIGYAADGQYSNIAIGYASSAYSGYDRVAIGRAITNRRNNSVALRGTLYLDGGTGLLYRSTVGKGGWTAKAFTIPHPLDPENKVLRHFCMEGPQVWNVYAGNVQLQDGRATVELPAYYTALNKVGSETYSLTPVGGPASIWVQEEVRDNRFVIGGDTDRKVSWTVKVLRNDPACREDLKRRPVEQARRELSDERVHQENTSVDTSGF